MPSLVNEDCKVTNDVWFPFFLHFYGLEWGQGVKNTKEEENFSVLAILTSSLFGNKYLLGFILNSFTSNSPPRCSAIFILTVWEPPQNFIS